MQQGRTRGSDGVRIIGGEWRGRRIQVPARTSVRPTPDRVRETLFNWLNGVIPGSRCLDLFAGTGVLGLEALSRGAEEAWLIERSPALVAALEERIADLGANARLIEANALDVIERPPAKLFDIVFTDPPYEMDLAGVLRKLSAWVARENLVYVERPAQRGANPLDDVTARVPGASVMKRGRAGSVAFGLLRLEN